MMKVNADILTIIFIQFTNSYRHSTYDKLLQMTKYDKDIRRSLISLTSAIPFA